MILCSYKEIYYNSEPFVRRLVAEMSDVSHRLLLKQRLQCKPFQHFIDRFRAIFVAKGMLPITAVCQPGFDPMEKKIGRIQNSDGSWTQVVFGDCN